MHALVARHDEAVRGLEEAGRIALADNRVVDVNVIDVEELGGRIRPLRLRERIRAEGPTIDYLPQARSGEPDRRLTRPEEFSRCTATTNSTTPLSPTASPSFATRWSGG